MSAALPSEPGMSGGAGKMIEEPAHLTAESFPHATSGSALSSAVQRLEATRALLKVALTPAPAPARRPRPEASAYLGRKWLSARLVDLKQLPGVDVLIDGLTAWWSQHPLRPVAAIVTEATNAAARPVAASNPLAMVGVAAAVGAFLAWAGPWRWLLRSALFAGIVPQLASRIVAKLPIESWFSMLSAVLKSGGRPASTEPVRQTASADSHPRFDQRSF